MFCESRGLYFMEAITRLLAADSRANCMHAICKGHPFVSHPEFVRPPGRCLDRIYRLHTTITESIDPVVVDLARFPWNSVQINRQSHAHAYFMGSYWTQTSVNGMLAATDHEI